MKSLILNYGKMEMLDRDKDYIHGVNAIVEKCLDDGFKLGVKTGLEYLKTFEFDILTVSEIIERYENKFNLVKKENAN